MCCLSLSLSFSITLSFLLPLYFLLREKQKVWQNKEKQKRLLCRVALRPPQLHQCHIEIRPLNSPSVVAATEVSGSGGFLFYLTCVMSLRGSESECVYKSSPSLCLHPSQGREGLWQWGIKSRYPRYSHQSARYYFIRLISGCLTPPSFCLVRPSAAEFLISAKTMACLSCAAK